MALNMFLDSFAGNIIAILADGNNLIEYYVEKTKKNQIVGSIYKGKVNNVLAGMHACFVDIGLDKNGYLYVGDTLVDKNLIGEERSFSELNLNKDDEIMVQAVKEPSGTKGVRLTKHLSLIGKNVVYMPSFKINSVSRKITNEKARENLEKILSKIKRKEGGFIARTDSLNATSKEIKEEAKNLVLQYEEILEKYKKANVGEVIYSDGDLTMRVVRDVMSYNVEHLYVADEDIYNRLKSLPKSMNKVLKKLVFYKEKEDMFKKFGLTQEIESLLHNRVNLSSGAYLIIDRTEAL